MRMYHPDLEYTKADGHETTEKAFRLAWEPKGWRVWPPVADFSFMDDAEDDDDE